MADKDREFTPQHPDSEREGGDQESGRPRQLDREPAQKPGQQQNPGQHPGQGKPGQQGYPGQQGQPAQDKPVQPGQPTPQR
ncbi:MAG TPA: hypothetical protein VID04_01335 [Methylomirabilota bacterium]|jgi:hypothetical protein